MKQLVLVLMAVVMLVLVAGDVYAGDKVRPLDASEYLTTTGTWQDIGGEIDVDGFKSILYLIDLTINGATDASFRCLGKHESDGPTEYSFPLKDTATSTSQVAVDQHIWVLTDDANQNIILEMETGNVPIVQLQGKCTYSSGTATALDAEYTRREK